MQNIKQFVFFILFILGNYSYLLNAQEILIPLNENSKIKQYLKTAKQLKVFKASDTLELPFFDDFSDSYLYPKTSLWADSFTFITNSYPDLPPSIGVATFDAIDQKGNFYSAAAYDTPYIADYLTSQPINLNYPGDQTIYLSFYYQPQGLGDYPEEKDSLIVEFYDIDTQTWDPVWAVEGSVNQDFEQVILQINQSKYLKKGFRFRFKNLASLSSSSVPSKVGNVDHWHVDYILLDRNRNASDIVHQDIAFVNPMYSFLKDYQAMPWKHFLSNPANELKSNIEVVYRNNDNINRLIDRRDFIFIDNSSSQPNDTLEGGASDMASNQLVNYSAPYSYSFTNNSADTASFTIKAKITTDDFDPQANNEINYVQKFYNYYAYDDGSAEIGYGLIGEGTRFAKLAYKFNTRNKDTLQAVQMYFNRTLNDASKKYFYLTIWEDDGSGQPGEAIYTQEGTLPEYKDELNQFYSYTIDTILILEGDFYVGWIQTTEDMLNIGFDVNTTIDNKIFYNISGDWINSKYNGSLMIRPVFGKALITSNQEFTEHINKVPEISIYPNPVKHSLNIRLKDYNSSRSLVLNIINSRGQIIYNTHFFNQTTVDFTGFKKGMYFLQLSDQINSFSETRKIIKMD